MNSLTLPLSASVDDNNDAPKSFPVLRVTAKPPVRNKSMTILLFGCLPLILISAGAFGIRLAEGTGTSEMVGLIGAFTALVGTITAMVVAILGAKSKSRLEELKLQGDLRLREIQALRQEVQDNTMLTHQAKKDVQASVDQTKVRVEELTRAVEDSSSKQTQ